MAPLLDLVDVERHHPAPDGGFLLSVPRLTLAAGTRTVVLGPSGSGKSTLLDLLAFLAMPQRSGRFVLSAGGEDHDIDACWRRGDRRRLARLRARHLGYVLQTGGLVPYLSVTENILLSRRLLGLPVPGPLDELAASVGVTALLRRMPGALSVGQRQRVALLRALAHEPALVLADEPTAALDRGHALEAADVLVAATERFGAAMVLVTHDETIAARIGGRVLQCSPLSDSASPTSRLEERDPGAG
jgi:putative ABC transport system ATP-binding protein